MSKTIRVSEEFHELVEAHNREGETMEETLQRLTRGPDPEVLAEVIGGGDEEAAARMREAIERKRDSGRDRREALRERFE
jgi:hypothetical protein